MQTITIEHTLVTITFRDDGIIHLDYKDGEMTLEKSKEIFALTRKFSPWEIAPIYITGGDNFHDHKDSKAFNGSDEVLKHCYAIAFLTDNVAKRVLANLFITLVKEKIPVRFFSHEGEAIQWLQSFLNKPT